MIKSDFDKVLSKIEPIGSVLALRRCKQGGYDTLKIDFRSLQSDW
jgi:hypothetical protein